MKQPNYLIFGLLWVMAGLVSVVNYLQDAGNGSPTPGNLIRGGVFLMMGIFYFWLNRKKKQDK